MEFTVITKDEFFDRTGIALDMEAPGTNNAGQNAVQYIVDAADDIITFIEANTPTFDKTDISVEQNEFINQAITHQIRYKLMNTDFALQSGFNPLTGQIVPQGEINARRIAPKAKELLKAKIIYRGF